MLIEFVLGHGTRIPIWHPKSKFRCKVYRFKVCSVDQLFWSSSILSAILKVDSQLFAPCTRGGTWNPANHRLCRCSSGNRGFNSELIYFLSKPRRPPGSCLISESLNYIVLSPKDCAFHSFSRPLRRTRPALYGWPECFGLFLASVIKPYFIIFIIWSCVYMPVLYVFSTLPPALITIIIIINMCVTQLGSRIWSTRCSRFRAAMRIVAFKILHYIIISLNFGYRSVWRV